jgi:membrane protease YdiL (CAAX protease family)
MNTAAAAPPSAAPDDTLARGLRGFGPIGLTGMLVVLAAALVPPLGAIAALAWTWRSRTPWSAVGFARPASWGRSLAAGIAIGVALKFALKAVVMPLLGAPAVNATYHSLTGNTAALPGMIVMILVVAAFGEETFYRGWLFERFGALLGTRWPARIAALLITTTLFAAAHLRDQGLPGAEQAALTGLVVGALYLRTRQLWVPMFAHAAYDLTALALIYWNLEERVAHLLFK